MLRETSEDKEGNSRLGIPGCGEGCRAGSPLISVRQITSQTVLPFRKSPIHTRRPICLVPVGGQNRLYFLRPLRDPLVPRETRLGRETRHRLNELLHLVV